MKLNENLLVALIQDDRLVCPRCKDSTLYWAELHLATRDALEDDDGNTGVIVNGNVRFSNDYEHDDTLADDEGHLHCSACHRSCCLPEGVEAVFED